MAKISYFTSVYGASQFNMGQKCFTAQCYKLHWLRRRCSSKLSEGIDKTWYGMQVEVMAEEQDQRNTGQALQRYKTHQKWADTS